MLLVAEKKPITIESITAKPASSDTRGPAIWAPDGKRFVYRQEKKIFLYDAAARSAKELLSLDPIEAAAVKEPPAGAFHWQNRRVSEDSIQWSENGKALLLEAGDDLFLWDFDSGKYQQLTATPEAERDPKLSPDGRRVSYRLDYDLYTLDVESRKVTRLTEDGSPTLLNGQLDWVYPEELDLGTAHWWSPDSKSIAFMQFDVSREPIYPHADLLGLRAVYEPQRYPQAGTPNADVRVGVVGAGGGATRWMNLGETRDALIARVQWLPDSSGVAVERLNRVQNKLDLMVADPASGNARVLLHESDPAWINVTDDLRFLKTKKQFLWSSERDGFRHLYLYSLDGEQIARLTQGDWMVTKVAGIDEARGDVFFESAEASPLESQLYRVKLDGSGKTRVTAEKGTHAIQMSPTCEYYFDTFSSLASPPRKTLHREEGSEWVGYREADRKVLDEYDILPTELVTVKASDGTTLYAHLIKPKGFREDVRYPAIVMVYGGPGVQTVRDAWAGENFEQVLAHRGYVIWGLDNRGSSGRSHRWESALYRRFGEKELADQQDGVRHLISTNFVDPKRIGIFGWSYGGFMTLYSLLNAPEMFRAGISGAPVTNWRNYDTIYTERYLGLPEENAEGYKLSSPVNAAAKLQAKLLLVHNTEDDNVLFQNTLQMIDALEQAGKQFELRLYPQKSHGVSGSARKNMMEAMAAFFDRNLRD